MSTTDLLDRIAALEALILDYRADHDDRLHENTDGNDVGCVCPLCDRAEELEVKP